MMSEETNVAAVQSAVMAMDMKKATGVLIQVRQVLDTIDVRGRNSCYAMVAVADDLSRVINYLTSRDDT